MFESRESTLRWSVFLLVCLVLLPLAPSSAIEPSEVSDELKTAIDDLVANAFDQRMARSYQMPLDLPVKEVDARFSVLESWTKAIRKGSFSGGTGKLPEDFDKQVAALRKSIDRAVAGETVDLDPVLLFIEQNTDALIAASGYQPRMPM